MLDQGPARPGPRIVTGNVYSRMAHVIVLFYLSCCSSNSRAHIHTAQEETCSYTPPLIGWLRWLCSRCFTQTVSLHRCSGDVCIWWCLSCGDTPTSFSEDVFLCKSDSRAVRWSRQAGCPQGGLLCCCTPPRLLHLTGQNILKLR